MKDEIPDGVDPEQGIVEFKQSTVELTKKYPKIKEASDEGIEVVELKRVLEMNAPSKVDRFKIRYRAKPIPDEESSSSIVFISFKDSDQGEHDFDDENSSTRSLIRKIVDGSLSDDCDQKKSTSGAQMELSSAGYAWGRVTMDL